MKRMLLSLTAFFIMAATPPSFAQMADGPLIIIRFPQPGVTYDQPLFYAVSQALETNPDMRFNVVGLSTRANSNDYAQQVATKMLGMGLPASRITVAHEQVKEQRAPEVHVFIQ